MKYFSSRRKQVYLGFLLLLWGCWAVWCLTHYYRRLFDPTESLGHILKTAFTMQLGSDHSMATALEAWGRMYRGIRGSLMVLVTAQLLGWGICRWLLKWNPENWHEGLLYPVATGLGAIANLSLGLAALGIYHPLSIKLVVILTFVSGSLVCYRYCSQSRIYISLNNIIFDSTKIMGKEIIWKTLIGAAGLIAFTCALAPEIEFDALNYHLAFPKIWLEKGYLVDLPDRYVSLYPMTWGLVYGAGLALGGPVAAKLLHFTCLPLTGLLTYCLTKRFFPKTPAWIAVALVVTTPTILWEATTAYNDLALAYYIGLAMYAILNYIENRDQRWLYLSATTLGIAIASKHLALFALVLFTGLLARSLWITGRNCLQVIIPTTVFCIFSFLPPLPWYIRSWLASGNPVFPELFSIFGAPPERWNAISENGLDVFLSHFGRPHSLENLLMLPWDITIHPAIYGGDFGPIFLIFIPALILPSSYANLTSYFLWFTLAYLGLWASPFCSFQIRFLVPIVPLLAILCAEAIHRILMLLSQFNPKNPFLLKSVIAILLLLNLPPFVGLHEGDRFQWEGWLTHVVRDIPLGVVSGRETENRYLSRIIPSYEALNYINTNTPQSSRILSFSDGDFYYSHRAIIPSYSTMANSVSWGAKLNQDHDLINKLHQLDITHILLIKKELTSSNSIAITQPNFIEKHLIRAYEDPRCLLFQVK